MKKINGLLWTALFLTTNLFAGGISGEWVAQVTSFGEPQYARVALETTGAKISGSWAEYKVDGTLTGDHVTFSLLSSDGKPVGTLTGVAGAAKMSGDGTMALRRRAGGAADKLSVGWKLER